MGKLSRDELKALAIELAAAMPPPHDERSGDSNGGSASAELDPQEALARLCNAECTLQLIVAHVNEHTDTAEGWRIGEALEGVLRLLDGCYVALGNGLNAAAVTPKALP